MRVVNNQDGDAARTLTVTECSPETTSDFGLCGRSRDRTYQTQKRSERNALILDSAHHEFDSSARRFESPPKFAQNCRLTGARTPDDEDATIAR
jgi:hypothetical protein